MSTTTRAVRLGRILIVAGMLLVAARGWAQSAAVAPADEAFERGYRSATGLLNRGLTDLAEAEYRELLDQHGGAARAPLARYGLALCLYRAQKFEPAVEELRKLARVKEFEYTAEVQAMLGQCLLAVGKLPEAAATLEAFLNSHRDHSLAPQVAAMRIDALQRQQAHTQVTEAAVEFAQRWPKAAERERVLLAHGMALAAESKWSEALKPLGKLLDESAPCEHRGQAAMVRAWCHEQQRELAEAEKWYQAAAGAGDERLAAEAQVALGRVRLALGRADEAGAALDRAMESGAAAGPAARLLRARAWFDAGEFERAAELLRPLADGDGAEAEEASYWLAKCHLRRREFPRAAELLEQAIERFPRSSLRTAMEYDRALALASTEKDDDAALQALREFTRKHREHALRPDALFLTASVAQRLARHDVSLEAAREFLISAGEHAAAPLVALLEAESLRLSGQTEQAAAKYSALLKAYPAHPQAAQIRLQLGLALYRLERFDEALEPLRAAAAQAEEDASLRAAWRALGEVAFSRGEWKAAEEALGRFVEGGGEGEQWCGALLKLALAQQNQNRAEDALRSLDRLLNECDKGELAVRARFERGQVLVSLDRGQQAEEEFARVSQAPEAGELAAWARWRLGTLALQRGERAAASEHFAAAAKSGASDELRARAICDQAAALLGGGQYAESERLLREFLERYAKHARAGEARVMLALAVARQQRAADALALIEQCEQHAEGISAELLRAALYEKAWCLREAGRKDEAAAAYRQVIEQATDEDQRAHAMLELADMEQQTERFDEAARLLTALRERMRSGQPLPSETAASAVYRLAVCELKRGRDKEAAELFEEFVQAFGSHDFVPAARLMAGEARYRLGQHQKAAEHLAAAVEAGGTNVDVGTALLRLGECWAALQFWDRSEREFEKYLKQTPTGPHAYQAHFGIGWARENLGRHDDARRSYEQVIRGHQGPTAARAQFQIGQCLFAQKKYEAAIRELLKVEILYAYPEWSAAALYEAGRCFEQLGKSVEARRQFEQVREKYGETRWAELAGQRLAATPGDGLPGRRQ